MTDHAESSPAHEPLEGRPKEGSGDAVRGERSLVPASDRFGGGRMSVADDAEAIAERTRTELATMDEARLLTDRQLELLGIVSPRSKDRALVDAFRQLRTKLYRLREENFSVLVSSVVPGGGGSFVAQNLAATIAFERTKTSLLVEANFDDPTLHCLQKLIGRDDVRGLIDYLESAELGIEDIVGPSGIPRMRVIAAGKAEEGGVELFGSARYRRLMSDLEERYDNRYLIVDGPPMSSSTDARILADTCDYTVLVVPYGKVSPGRLDAIVDEIDESRLAGIVINDRPV